MIAIEEAGSTVEVSIYGEFTLADYRRLEHALARERGAHPRVGILVDLRAMTGYTLDVAWEEVKFTRAHAHDFRRIAVVTRRQWGTWLSWIAAAFTDAELMLFEDPAAAQRWLAEAAAR
ncbi:MAG TPA: STAS/SEC14 domain-containing protein [Burkholderiales bacterium]